MVVAPTDLSRGAAPEADRNPPGLTAACPSQPCAPAPVWTKPVSESGRARHRDPDATAWGLSPEVPQQLVRGGC